MNLSASRSRGKAARIRTRLTRRSHRRQGVDSRVVPLALAAGGGVVAGTLLEFFLDPRSGRRRRHTARDRTRARLRRGERRAMVGARRAESRAAGFARRTVNARRGHPEPVDDLALAQKVESQIYRLADVPKGHISVNAEDGVVFLRGTTEHTSEMVRLVEAARSIDGVKAVESLIHTPGTPAPQSTTKLEREGGVS